MNDRMCFSLKKLLILTAIAANVFFPSFSQNLNAEGGGVERYAVFVGSNNGGKNNQRLLYAGADAIAFQKTMSEIGGIPSSNAILLLDPAKDDLDEAMQTISEKIRHNKGNTKRSEFLFYYSGHSDEKSLLLGKSNYDYSSLKSAVSAVPSDIHVVILDSCFSGNFIRTKGGQKKKPFLIDDSSVVKGHAYLSSSSSQESSQESDEIGSSFFTNAMITGLRGAADSSGDKKVTLNELYSYAFSETLAKTENTQAGPQHPNYNITLVGSGDLVLSDISNSDSIVLLSSDLTGRIILRDKNGKLISEINKTESKPVFLALERGIYSATLIEENVTKQGSFSLNSGKVYELSENSLSPLASSPTRLRGESQDDVEDERDEAEKTEEDSLPFGAIQHLSEDDIYIPVEFSLVNNEISRHFNKRVCTSFSIGLIRSKVYKTDGIMLAIGINEADFVRGVQAANIFNRTKDLHGVQASGIFNISQGVRGVQTAGIYNLAHNIKGLQASGIFNTAHGIEGIQASGIFNKAYDVKGFQASGIINSSRDFTGFQIAGILNRADNTKGFQTAGIVNAAKEFTGLQLAGIVNYADRLSPYGLQIGLINIAREADGIQLGLLNFSKNGIFEFGTSFTSNANMRLSLNSGNKWLYTVLGASGKTKDFFTLNENNEVSGLTFFGLGTRLTFGMFNFDFEGCANLAGIKKNEAQIAEEKARAKNAENVQEYDVYFFPSVRFSAGCSPVKHLRIFAGAIFYLEYSANEKLFEKLDTNLSLKAGDKKIHSEFEVGVKFSLN